MVAIAVIILITNNPAQLGDEPPVIRALVLSIAIIAALVAVFPLNPLFAGRPGTYVLTVCIPALLPGFIFYLLLLPNKSSLGFEADQLASSLISDRSSNGIIEVGFRYPIFTPTISVKNLEIYTRRVNVFLRITDSNGGSTLFRGVRQTIPGNRLSVESTVQGMLSENENYLFNPLVIPPDRSLSGQVVFIISNLEDGTAFTDALNSAYQAQFELRDPENGRLLLEFPLQHI